jgi:hypothetical protein
MIKNNWLKNILIQEVEQNNKVILYWMKTLDRYKWNRTINLCLEDKMHVAKTSHKVKAV